MKRDLSNIPPPFRSDLPQWTRRKRLQRLWEGVLRGLPVAFSSFFLLCLILWVLPSPGWGIALIVGSLVFALLVFLLPALKPIRSTEVLRDVDAGLETKDLALTVGDSSLDSQWQKILQARLHPHLSAFQAKRIWPLNSTGLQKVWMGACLLMGANVLLTAAAVRTAPEPRSFVASEETAAFEEMLADWEEIAPDVPSEEFQAILKEVEELRSESDPSKQNTAERMELLSKIEAVVEKHRRSQSESSISEHAGDLAALLESVEGMSGTAASLRRGDFSSAGQSLEEMAAALMQAGELPPGAASEDFQRQAEKLSQLAQKEGNDDLADVLKKLAAASAKKDPAGWCDSAGALGACMNQEGARALADRLMQAQLDQLDAQKLALSQNKRSELSSLAAILARQNSNSAGLQAGKGRGGEPFGEATEPDGSLETLTLSGTPGQGDSTVETLRSSEAPTEVARTGGQASFEEYQALSTQAIHDESLPLVHRETIRRYFERIRPRSAGN